jgi:hypothetical protein
VGILDRPQSSVFRTSNAASCALDCAC